MFTKHETANGNTQPRVFPLRAAPLTAGATLAVAGVAAACAAHNARVVTPNYAAPVPAQSVLYTATKCVRALTVSADGGLWAATEGGVIFWANGGGGEPQTKPPRVGAPRVWTTANGLVSNDIRAVTVQASGARRVTVSSPMGASEIAPQSGAVSPQKAPTEAGRPIAAPPMNFTAATVRGGADGGAALTATPSGLVWSPKRGAKGRIIALPGASRASHVSAVAPVRGVTGAFVAGLYGDGAYRLTLSPGRPPVWERLPLRETCRFVTALAFLPNGDLAVGTRRDGAFWVSLGKSGVTCAPLPDVYSLPSGDIYGLAAYGGSQEGASHLFATTFDQGVLEISERGLLRVHKEVAQGRALATFGDKLYVLRADHTVWAFDGDVWAPAWPKGTLRRADVYSVFADRRQNRLLVGGWGGWAEWDGSEWREHWNAPDLRGESVTAIVADNDGAVWIGTQRKGLVRCAPSGDYAAFHEAHGLTDDWITALAVSPQGRLLVGTYTGGLLERDTGGDRFVLRFRADKWTIRALAFHGEQALAATPVGVWKEPAPSVNGAANHSWRNLSPATTGGAEAQALLTTPEGGAWIGTRSGLAFTPGGAQEN